MNRNKEPWHSGNLLTVCVHAPEEPEHFLDSHAHTAYHVAVCDMTSAENYFRMELKKENQWVLLL